MLAQQPSRHAVGHVRRVLVVEDQPEMLSYYAWVLQSVATVVTARSIDEAVVVLGEFDVVVSDLDLGHASCDGIWFLEFVRRHWPRTRCILATGSSEELVYQRIRSVSLPTVDVVLFKPFPGKALLDAVTAA